MRIIFESKNNRLQEPAFLPSPATIRKTDGLNDFQKGILEYLFQNPKFKIADTSMLGNKMALEVVKKG